MKVYNLNIDTSKPTNQVVQMQQNATGLLSANITNDGKYIRNLSCMMYDGANEIEATTSADASFGFKVDVGSEPKHVKVVAKSTPIESVAQKILSATGPAASKALSAIQLEAGIYNQDEFYNIANVLGANNLPVFLQPHASQEDNINIKRIDIKKWVVDRPVLFWGKDNNILPVDEPIVATGPVSIFRFTTSKKNATLSSYTYPAVGYYTDYQLDTLVKPSDNAPYDGNYVEPLKEVEVDGVKFVPTTLSVDGVEYKVLAEAQPAPEPEPEPEAEPEEPTTNDGE